MSKCQLCSAKCASWLSSEGQFTLLVTFLQRFAVPRRLKVTLVSLFYELLRLGHNELVCGPKFANSASRSPCECALPGDLPAENPVTTRFPPIAVRSPKPRAQLE